MPEDKAISQCGKVIDYDFRPKLNFKVNTKILYLDEAVCLTRVTVTLDGAIVCTEHVTVPL